LCFHYQGDESHKADEYIRFIKDKLPEAIIQCLKAASEEFFPVMQQSLLKVSRIELMGLLGEKSWKMWDLVTLRKCV